MRLNNAVDKYIAVLAELVVSVDMKLAIAKKIRRSNTDGDALVLFQNAVKVPITWPLLIKVDKNNVRKGIVEIQKYVKAFGVEVPLPNKTVQKFLSGVKYSVKEVKEIKGF